MSAAQAESVAVAKGGAGIRGVPAFERRTLLLAPTGNDAKLTSHFLEGAGFVVEVCHSMDEVCSGVAEGCGSVLVAEETLGPRSMAALLETLEQQPSWSDVPVTIITGGNEVVKHRLRRLSAAGMGSNMGLLERPFHPETLLSTVGVAWRARQRQYQVRDLLRSQRESERRMVSILESISDAFVSLDREWRFTYVNPTYMKLVENLFSSVDQLVGECLWDKFPDVEGTPVGDFYKRTMAEQRPGVFEVFYGPVDRWLEVHAYPTPELLSLYMRDVTERRQHEAAMKQMHRQIEDQARLFDATLSHMADLAYALDREGRFIYGNQKLLQVLGRPLDEVVGRNVFDLGYPPELAEKLHGQILGVIATGKPVKDETIFVSADGEAEIHEYIFNPVFADDGTVKAVAGTTRFVTQRKQQEKALHEAKETAEAANRAKDRFLAVLSHELRTPLTPVMMTVSALEMDPELPPAIRADMSMIRRNVELETKLIDDLLDLSRIISSKLALRLEALDLNEVVREACAICRPQMLEKSIRLEPNLAVEPLPILADSARFQQVLWNVLKNAVKFTPEHGVIRVATRRGPDERAEVMIEDSGMGIAPEMLTKIFDAFEQGDPSITRAFGGLGLGLAISRALMELHGGSISAASDGSGKGAVFTMLMPLYAGAPTHEVSGPAPPPESHPQRLRLLVVEDHADTARTLGLLLRRAGFVVTTAGDVSTALRLADAQRFDVLISDVGLPDGTGFELMKQLAKNHALPGIAMSGFGLETDVAKSLEAGFREHLVKPVRVAQLEQAIRRVMAKG